MIHFGFTASDLRRIAWTAIMAFVGVFFPLASGAGGMKNYATMKAAALALLPTALAAAFSAIKNGVLADSSKAK